LTKSEEERWLIAQSGCLSSRESQLSWHIDITKRKQAEGEIRQALEQEKELGEQRARLSLWFLMNSAPR